MKILMICDFFHENQQYQENLLAKYYLKQGHRVTIIASTFESIFDYYSGNYSPACKFRVYNSNGYKIIRQPYSINLFNKLRKLKNLRKLINEDSPDLIYVHGVPLNLAEPVSYKRKNQDCKIVFDSHADYSNSAKNWLSLKILHSLIYRTIMRLYFKKLDNIFYITPNGGTFLNKVYRIPYNCMSFLPLGADTEYINEINAKETNISIRDRLRINRNDFVIFAGGKITKEKKIDLVIKAFFLVESLNAHLIIVGDTKDQVYKKEILELINFHPRIYFIGWVNGEKVYDYMSACDVAVFPASQSVLWQQAIGTGLPLIVGQTEQQDATYLNKYNNIIIIEEDSVSETEIFRKVKSLMDDKKLLTSMKLNAIKTSNELLSYKIISQRTLK